MGSTRDKVKRAVRKTVKWGGAGLTVLLVVVWIGSAWWYVSLEQYGRGGVVAGGGRVVVKTPLPAKYIGDIEVECVRADLDFFWWFYTGAGRSCAFMVSIPLWAPMLIFLLPTAFAWRADAKYMRRARVGLCAACGYDRAGLAAGAVCPECGVAPSAR